ncbi:MAG: tetratricopeptide repeat protein [bacterium]|nr:tetratricopeptide repeat protein [bacterium]
MNKTISLIAAIGLVAVALAAGFFGGVVFSSWSMRTMTAQLPSGAPPSPMAEMPRPPSGAMPSSEQAQAVGPAKINRDEAILKMEEMLKADPNNLMALVHLGNFYYDSNQPKKAIEMYERAIKINPQDPDVITDCGIMYREIQQYDKAIEYFKRAAKISPTHFQSWFNLGVVYRNDKKDYPKAIEAWQKAISLNPNLPNIEHIRAEIAAMQEMLKTKK